ncbi:MAG TPA: hypothetical protein VF813_01285, partial [Anaerolineaceae bacterium]
TDEDMEYQLSRLTLEENSLKHELDSYTEVIDFQKLGDWEKSLSEYFLDLRAGFASLDEIPEDEKDAQEVFSLKRDLVKSLVKRVSIDRKRDLQVEVQVDVLAILKNASKLDFSAIQRDGIYTRRPAFPAHPHPSGSSA